MKFAYRKGDLDVIQISWLPDFAPHTETNKRGRKEFFCHVAPVSPYNSIKFSIFFPDNILI